MGDERQMILQLVAERRITPAEAEELLEAIDETAHVTERAAEENVKATHKGGDVLEDWGDAIERSVKQGLRNLDEALDHMERTVKERLSASKFEELRDKIEAKLQWAAERTVETATKASQAAAKAVPGMLKTGSSPGKAMAEAQISLSVQAGSGDRFKLDNEVGDVKVYFVESDKIDVQVRKTAWGQDQKEAEDRAEATKVTLTRRDTGVSVDVVKPTLVGVRKSKETRLDYEIRLPHGTHLDIRTRVGDLRVEADGQVGDWDLKTQIGDVTLVVGSAASFQFDLATGVGTVEVDLAEPVAKQRVKTRAVGAGVSGLTGGGHGEVEVEVNTGDICVTTQ